MSRMERVNRLRNALQTSWGRGSVSVVANAEVDACDVCIQAGSGLAFMSVIEPEQSVEEVWMRAQTQIDAFCDKRYRARRPDLYLVLVSEGKLDPEDVALQAIASDPYVCRKLILEWGDHPLESLLDCLPFWPLKLPELTLGEPTSPATSMTRLGYDSAWVDCLQGRSGVKKIADQLLDGRLKIASATNVTTASTTDQEAPHARQSHSRGKITSAEVQGFRVFGTPRELDLDANLVVIYGRNSTGKTSLCEALEWGLLGEVERLKKPSLDAPAEAEHPVLNLTTRKSRVKLTLDRAGTPRTIERWMSQAEGKKCEVAGRSVTTDRDSILKAVDADLPENASSAEIRESFRRYHFLNQTSLRDFLCEVPPTDRYQFLRPMLGTAVYGRVHERAENIHKELNRVNTAHQTELAEAEMEVSRLKDELTKHDAQIHQSMSEIGLRDPDQAVADAHALAVELGLTRETVRPQNLGAVSALAELLSTSIPAQLEAAQESAHELDAAKAKVVLRLSLEREQSALAASLSELRSQRDRASSQRVTCSATVRTISERLAENRERIATIDVIRSGYERLTSLEGELRDSEAKLALLTPQQQADIEVQACRARVEKLDQEITAVQEQYYERRKSLKDAEHILQKAIDVRGMLTDWLASQTERDECLNRLSEAIKTRENLNRQAEELDLERARLEGELSSAQEHAAQLGRALSERNQLLIALQAHVDGDQCPLCRHTWPTHDALVAAVESASNAGSPELQRLEEKQRAAVSNLAEVRERVSARRTANAEVEHIIRAVRSRVQEFDALTTALTAALRQLSSDSSPGSGSMDAVESAISSAQTHRDAIQGEIQAIEKTLHNLQIDLEHAKEGLSGQEERYTASAAERRKLESRITQIHAELGLTRARSDQRAGGDLQGLIEEEASTQDLIRSLSRQLDAAKAELQRADDELQAVTEREKQANSASMANGSRLDGLAREIDRLGLDRDGANLGTLSEAASQKLRALTSLLELVPTVGTYARLKTIRESTDKTKGEWERFSAKAKSVRERIDQLGAMISQCDRFISDLSRVAKDEETRRLQEYGPTINQIYQRLNRHPYFGDLVFEVNQTNGEFKVQVGYNHDKDSAVAAVDYFSASQANVLALSVFLTSALLQNWSTLSTIIMDDPVQHLDDLNTQSLLDLLQGLAALDRQVIVTTSNISLYKLMLIKYSHLNATRPKSFKAFRLRGIRHEGPEVFDDTAAAT